MTIKKMIVPIFCNEMVDKAYFLFDQELNKIHQMITNM